MASTNDIIVLNYLKQFIKHKFICTYVVTYLDCDDFIEKWGDDIRLTRGKRRKRNKQKRKAIKNLQLKMNRVDLSLNANFNFHGFYVPSGDEKFKHKSSSSKSEDYDEYDEMSDFRPMADKKNLKYLYDYETDPENDLDEIDYKRYYRYGNGGGIRDPNGLLICDL